MATALGKTQCVTCGKEKVAYKCEGCSKHFCFNHLADHRQMLIQQLDEAEDKRNVFQQILLEQASDPRQQRLVQQINQWEKGARSGRIVVGGNGPDRRNNQLHHPVNVIKDQGQSVYVSDCTNSRVMKWMKGTKCGMVVAGNQSSGIKLTQLSHRRGTAVDQWGTVYVADAGNRRMMCWLTGVSEGSIVVNGHGIGQQPNNIGTCLGLSFDKQNNLYLVDQELNLIQMFQVVQS